MTKTALLLLAHGSRDPQWQRPMQSVAQTIRAGQADALVACAFLELCEPNFATAVAQLLVQGATEIRVLPLFLGMGQHARADLPRLLEAFQAEFAPATFTLLPTIGEDPRVLNLLAEIGLSALQP